MCFVTDALARKSMRRRCASLGWSCRGLLAVACPDRFNTTSDICDLDCDSARLVIFNPKATSRLPPLINSLSRRYRRNELADAA